MNNILEKLGQVPSIPVFYHDNSDRCIQIIQAAYDGGIRLFEFVNRGDKALENFKVLIDYKNKHLPELTLGIGTIKTADEARLFLDAGAEFLVSPIVSESIAQVAKERNVLWIPGCMTPTEIALAEQLQAPLVKLFPGDTLGPSFLKAIKPLFRHTLFMPTGGVNVEESNIKAWFDAGVYAVGLGSKLFEEPIGATDLKWLTERCEKLVAWARNKK